MHRSVVQLRVAVAFGFHKGNIAKFVSLYKIKWQKSFKDTACYLIMCDVKENS